MPTETDEMIGREAVSADDKWNVEALFPSFEEWEKALEAVFEQKSSPHWPKLSTFKGRLKEGPKVVQEALKAIFTISRQLEKLFTYAHLRHDEEITLDTYKGAFQRISSLGNDFRQESAWFEPELLSLDPKTVQSYLKSDELAPYRFYLEKIVRMQPHTLSADKEELLAMAAKPFQTPSRAFSALNNADIKFGKVQDSQGKERPLSHGLYQLYLRSPDRTLRKHAFEEMLGRFKGYENTLSELLLGQVQHHAFEAKARHFNSSLEAALFPRKIPLEVYTSLIASVRRGLPALHRYVSLRKRTLGVSELHFYDLYVPLVPEVEIKMDYTEAQKTVIASVAPLGQSYQSALEKGLLGDRWVDRFENRNKRSGAYSSGCFDSFPYILMNFRGILRDTFTLAHEAGHSMHSYLSHKNQAYHDSHYPIFVAEVASTFNEELLMHKLLKETQGQKERLFLVNEKIEDIRATLFRQAMFAEFELKIHELVEKGTPLTPGLLRELYLQLNADYFGPEIVLDEEIGVEWARIPHFYYHFYVYQYATGISAALFLAEKVLSGDTTARDAYLSFLKGGGSLFPIDLLKLAGVDMTSPSPVEAAIRKFDGLVSQLEAIL